VPDLDNNQSGNFLLAALSDDDRALLKPHLERMKLDRDQVLVEPNQPIEHVYFPEGGIASITAKAENIVTEVGIFGRDGVSATALLLGTDRSPHETFLQVDGSHACRISADRFMTAVESSSTLRQTMLRYVQTLLIQTAQSAVANARYQIEARLARWLLMCHDRVKGDEIALTHEFMGMMIGAQRSGVTVALHVLEGIGMIRAKRGRVTILDRDKLEELAGDSYGPAEAEYRRLIGPFQTVTTVRAELA
jgi:CRP-like cAMP-binding protein